MFKLSFCGSDKKCQKIIFLTPFWGTSKNLWLDPKVCADLSCLLVYKNGLKKSSSLKNQSFWWPKWPKKARNLWWNFFGPPKPPFLYKGYKNLYIQNVGHIWAYIHANSQDFWKSFNGSDKTKHVKKCGKKMQNNNFFKTTFWGTSKNRRLDLKVCADSSWLLVFKNGLKKHSSLIIDQVIDVWSRCKKRDGGGEGEEEGRGRGGGVGDQLGFGVLMTTCSH